MGTPIADTQTHTHGQTLDRNHVYHILYNCGLCPSVCVCVCVSSIGALISGLNSTKVGGGRLLGKGVVMRWLLIHSVEVLSAEPSHINWKCPYLGNGWTYFNQSWCMDAYTMWKNAFKKPAWSRSAAPSYFSKTGSAIFQATTRLISTKVGVWLDTLCKSLNLKNHDNQKAQHQVTALRPEQIRPIEVRSAKLLPLHQEVLEPRCEVPGIEVHSIGSRCQAPRIGWACCK